ncbi:Hypothetical predicted protein [Olea europaea subsp. europaea]|uniref:Uncharacterized protein n=1 Tax=Olea europaea subsp. europaea TaxID=158383 RepID=A0A8S0RPX5_OLEEU|nr:Hypothetical predicted protein [Olea europaea subsp. europaea]
MSVQRKERSQPRRDRASYCGVRGADGDLKRGASGERLEGRDSGKKLLQRREGPAQGAIATAEESGQRLWGLRCPRLSKSRGQRGALGGAEWRKKFLRRREGERSQPRRDRARDCGVRGASIDRKRGASGERLEGRDRGKNCFSGEKVIAVGAYLMSIQRRERSKPRRDRASDCGVRGASGDRKRGPAGSAWRGGIGEKIASVARMSLIAVRAYLMSVQRKERSQPRRDRASDCGVRGAGGDRKRRASVERLKGRDRGKNCFSGKKGKKKIVQKEKRSATRGLSRGSTILGLPSPEHA